MNNIGKIALLGALTLSGLEGCGKEESKTEHAKKACEIDAEGYQNGREWAYRMKRSMKWWKNDSEEGGHEFKAKCDALIKDTQRKVMELCMESKVGIPVTCTETENTHGVPKFNCTEDK